MERIRPLPPLIDRHGVSPVLFAVLVLLFLFFLYQGVGGAISYLLFGSVPIDDNVTGYRVVTGIGQILFLLIPTILLVRMASLRPSAFLQLRRADIRLYGIAFAGIFSLSQVLQLYIMLQEKIPLPENIKTLYDELESMFEEAYKALAGSSSPGEFLFVLLIIAVIPGVTEELLFRGLIQRSFARRMSQWKAALITGVVFALYHLNPFSFIPLAVLGIYLGFLAMRARSVWVAAAAHFFNNMIACAAFYLNLDDSSLVTGNPEEMPLPSLLLTGGLSLVVFILSVFLVIRLTPPADVDAEIEPAGTSQTNHPLNTSIPS